MGFWNRLFGERETAEQKMARASAHLDDGEPKLALNIVAHLDGPDVDALRRRARELAAAMEQGATERPQISIAPDDDDPLHAKTQPKEDAPAKSKARERRAGTSGRRRRSRDRVRRDSVRSRQDGSSARMARVQRSASAGHTRAARRSR